MLQANAPDAFEDSHSYPGLEAQMTGAAGTVQAWDHLPLAAGAQHVKDPVEDRTVQHPRPAVGAGRFVRWQDGFDQFPQVIGNFAESIPLLPYCTHREVLPDFTMILSALTYETDEGF